MSYWNKWELRQLVMKMRLQQKFISSGYSLNEFGDAKKEISLSPEEKKFVNEAVFDIWKFSSRDTANLESEDYRKIENLTKKGFTFMDILLIIQAKKSLCDFFVTKDNNLKHMNYLSNQIDIKVIGIKEFLDKLKNQSSL